MTEINSTEKKPVQKKCIDRDKSECRTQQDSAKILLPLTTLGQETRWTYFIQLPSRHVAQPEVN